MKAPELTIILRLDSAHDLTDRDVTMLAEFRQEFVKEIEASLVKDPELNKYEIKNHSASLNPQNQE